MDRFTRWLQAYPSQTKNTKEVMLQLQRFFGPQCKPDHMYTDNAGELVKAAEKLGWLHDTSTPWRSETNGVIERAVRIVKEGVSCALVQSGFNSQWWAEAMMCFCFLKNVHDLLDGDETSFKRRYGANFYGPIIPFGCHISYKPITPQDIARLPQFGSNNLEGIFVGYSQQAGGGWDGDLLIVDWHELEEAEFQYEVKVKRFKEQEVTVLKFGDKFRFPLAECALKQPGGTEKSRVRRRKRRKAPAESGENVEDENENRIDRLPIIR